MCYESTLNYNAKSLFLITNHRDRGASNDQVVNGDDSVCAEEEHYS